jgi:chemotaxis protein CheX
MMIEQVLCLNTLLLDSAKEIFETMIFMDMLEGENPGETIEGDAVLSSITFKGDMEGCLGISCEKKCAQVITMNMLGADSVEGISDEDMCDAVGEVANMVMGSVKKRLHDTYPNLELSIPLVVNGRQLKNNLGEGTKQACTKVKIEDEYPAELSLLYREKSN